MFPFYVGFLNRFDFRFENRSASPLRLRMGFLLAMRLPHLRQTIRVFSQRRMVPTSPLLRIEVADRLRLPHHLVVHARLEVGALIALASLRFARNRIRLVYDLAVVTLAAAWLEVQSEGGAYRLRRVMALSGCLVKQFRQLLRPRPTRPCRRICRRRVVNLQVRSSRWRRPFRFRGEVELVVTMGSIGLATKILFPRARMTSAVVLARTA